jgi:hypothetical protein
MRRFVLLLLLTASVLWPGAAAAHDVPDLVKIAVFVKPERDHLSILVRMPANALIDFLFPTLADSNWVDLAHADSVAAEGARVWIADLLTLSQHGRARAEPRILAVHLSRVNDPSFRSFPDALARITGPPLPPDTLVLQDQLTVDTLLQTPIVPDNAAISFAPRFARLGVVVETTLTMVTPEGTLRRFQYQGDPEPFELNPGVPHAFARFTREGASHYLGDVQYLLFAACAALVFRRARLLVTFLSSLVLAESATVLLAIGAMPLLVWIPAVSGVLAAAATIYLAIEAIVAPDDSRPELAVGTGFVMGCALWAGLQPTLQFGGSHSVAAGAGFALGAVAAEGIVVVGAATALRAMLSASRAQRAVLVIAAAFAIHVSWRRMLEGIDTFFLMPVNPYRTFVGLAMVVIAAGAATAAAIYLKRPALSRSA